MANYKLSYSGSQIDELLIKIDTLDTDGLYIHKGSVDNIDALPLTGNAKGYVYDVVYKYSLLAEEPSDWETSYTNYYTKSGSVYTPVTGAAAPTFVTNTYYSRSADGNNYVWTLDSSSGTIDGWDSLSGRSEIQRITKADIDALFV